MPVKKLLIVDDEQSVLSAVSRCLLESPYRVLTAASAAEGLAPVFTAILAVAHRRTLQSTADKPAV